MQRMIRRGTLVLAALAVFVVPIAVSAAGGFTDVADDNIFKADIQWMADNDITRGCNPPTNDKFCPSSVVTRETMSAFMHRLGVNKVVDAATAVTADDADMLDSYNSDELVRVYGSERTNNLTGTGDFTLATLVADAPVAGLLAITAVTDIQQNCSAPGGGLRGFVQLEVNGTNQLPMQEAREECAVGAAYTGSATAAIAVEVPAGTHTIDLLWESALGNLFSANGRITAIFTPFGSAPSVASVAGASATNSPTP